MEKTTTIGLPRRRGHCSTSFRVRTADEVPAEVLHESTRCLLDHLGLAIAGAAEPAASIARAQCRLLGGEPQAMALGTFHRLRVTDAALVNGIACHALDFDDTHVPTILHPTTPLYAAGTALAEWRGSRGIDLLAAHALGYELAARVSNALYPEHYDAGWHMTGTTGALASAAVAIRLLRLTGATATHCLSIAATQAAGHREQFGTMTKPFHAGHAAQAGVWAGLLAAGGFTGAPDPLQGRRGMFAVMSSASTPADLVDGLGRAVADLRQWGQAVRMRRGDPPGHRRGARPRHAQGLDRRADRQDQPPGASRWSESSPERPIRERVWRASSR